MAGTWTVGIFTVNPGREDDFLRILSEAGASMEGALARPTVRDRERPNVFITMTPWESVEAVDRFRAGPMRELLEKHADVLESVEPRTLDEIGAVD